MQIYNNPQILQTTTVPSFKAIKSVKCEGLYKDFPKYGKELVDSFKSNKTAMDFCRKYDVDLVFHACKDMLNSVKSTILLIFENPTKSKFLGFLGSRKDKIELSGYGNAYNYDSSLKASTNTLIDYMSDSTTGKPVSGLLDQHISIKEQEIQKALDKKNEKNNRIKALNDNKNIEKTLKQVEKRKLNESIQDLINKGV